MKYEKYKTEIREKYNYVFRFDSYYLGFDPLWFFTKKLKNSGLIRIQCSHKNASYDLFVILQKRRCLYFKHRLIQIEN